MKEHSHFYKLRLLEFLATHHCTKVHFASLLFGRFTTMTGLEIGKWHLCALYNSMMKISFEEMVFCFQNCSDLYFLFASFSKKVFKKSLWFLIWYFRMLKMFWSLFRYNRKVTNGKKCKQKNSSFHDHLLIRIQTA